MSEGVSGSMSERGSESEGVREGVRTGLCA